MIHFLNLKYFSSTLKMSYIYYIYILYMYYSERYHRSREQLETTRIQYRE